MLTLHPVRDQRQDRPPSGTLQVNRMESSNRVDWQAWRVHNGNFRFRKFRYERVKLCFWERAFDGLVIAWPGKEHHNVWFQYLNFVPQQTSLDMLDCSNLTGGAVPDHRAVNINLEEICPERRIGECIDAGIEMPKPPPERGVQGREAPGQSEPSIHLRHRSDAIRRRRKVLEVPYRRSR